MKKIITIMLISAFGLLTLNACSTIEGAGKDIEGFGQSIKSEAKKAKKG